MSRKVELVFAALFALFFIGWLTFDMPVSRTRPRQQVHRLVRARGRPDLPSSAIVAEDCGLVRVRLRTLLFGGGIRVFP
jgi:hypothetical protein